MKWLLALFLLVAYNASAAPMQRVAVIDTGLDITDVRFKDKLCTGEHWNFANNSIDVSDVHGHGTHVAGSIKKYAGNSNYCMIIVKYYDVNNRPRDNARNIVLAIRYAVQHNASIINISSGGFYWEDDENNAIKYNPKTTFVVAAGNENKDIDKDPYYPASYGLPNMVVVGSLAKWPPPVKSKFSNYGTKITHWELGENIYAEQPGGKYGFMSGTSMATGITTGKLIKERNKK